MFALSDYWYDLPKEQIAQVPCLQRSRSRLLHLDRKTHEICHGQFSDIVSLFKKDDLLVVNDTRVIPARLMGKKQTGGKVEVLIIDYTTGMKNLKDQGFFQCDCLIRASKSPKEGATILFKESVQAEVIKCKGYIFEVRFSNGTGFLDFLNRAGQMPLPPYIQRETDQQGVNDAQNYQTVYAKNEGAVAAPTAGLHFTDDLMTALKKKGVDIVNLTLHVGYGTFVPVRVKDIRDHQIHSEYFSLSEEVAQKINQAKAQGRRVVAVGTTSVRTLEYVSGKNGQVKAQSGQCDLFIYPGYTFKCVDAMITNFHLPESTLLMLISAFYEKDKIINAYKTAVKEGYRFFSYGDAMFIE